MTRLPRLALTLLLAVAGVVACGEEESPPAARTGPPPAPGFSRVIGSGFTLDVPAAWERPALDAAAYDQTAAALREQNPELAKALEESRPTGDGGSRLFAMDPSDGSSVNLIVTASGGRSLDELVAQAVKELQQVGAAGIKEERTTLGQQPAARVEFALPVRGQSGELAVPEVQYYVVRSDELFILTLFGASPSLPAIADSLRFS